MTRLFINLYLGEDMDILIADLLHARGFYERLDNDLGIYNALILCVIIVHESSLSLRPSNVPP